MATRLDFDGGLYRAEAVRQAAAEFAGVARVTVRRSRRGLQVTLAPLAAADGAPVRATADGSASPLAWAPMTVRSLAWIWL